MPIRIHVALDRWRAAERALAALPEDSPHRHDAEDDVVHARDEYLAIVRIVAEEQGPEAMPDSHRTADARPRDTAAARRLTARGLGVLRRRDLAQ